MSAACSVSEPEQSAAAKELPAFGSGIEFRPQSKRSKDAPVRSAGADQSNKSGTVAVQLMEQKEVVEDMQVPCPVILNFVIHSNCSSRYWAIEGISMCQLVCDVQEAMDVEEDAPVIMQPRKPRRNFRAKPAGEQPAD